MDIDSKYYGVELTFNNYYKTQFMYTGMFENQEVFAYFTASTDDEYVLKASYIVAELVGNVRWFIFLVPPT